MLDVLRLIVGFFLGFFIPGYGIALLCDTKLRLVSSFIISYLILFQLIFILGFLGIAITFSSVVFSLTITSSIIWAYVIKKRKQCIQLNIQPFQKENTWYYILFILIITLLLFRSFLRPLLSTDSVFRWNYLAELMLKHSTFTFYPPVTKYDYYAYFYSEGIPPMVSFSYFWLYASFSKACKSLTSILVVFQFLCTTCLIFQSSILIFKKKEAGFLSIALFISSSMVFFAFLIGQETGLISLSLIATLFYILQAGKNNLPLFLLAGIASALGALSREYGIIIIFCGCMFAYWKKCSIKGLTVYLLTAIILVAPWYVRNWIITGNPFYCNLIANFFAVNKVHVGIFRIYASKLSLSGNLSKYLLEIGKNLLIFAPSYVILLCVLPFHNFKKYGYLFIASLLIIILWLYSITQTIGGVFYSMRVLSPAFTILAVWGGFYARFLTQKIIKRLSIILLSLIIIFEGYINITSPYLPWKIPIQDWKLAGFTPVEDESQRIHKYFSPLKENEKILSNSAFYQAGLFKNNQKNLKMIAVWSPEVKFLFNSKCSFTQGVLQLRAKGIKYVLYSHGYNNIYLMQFPFFSEYRKYSKPLAQGYDAILYQLPVNKHPF